MISTVLCVALMGTPFVDTLERFKLDLPDGWYFAPQPGDINGVTFSLKQGGVPAHLTVKVLEAPQIRLDTYFERVLSVSKDEPGYRQLAKGDSTLSGLKAKRLRYVIDVPGQKKWQKMVEERVGVWSGKAYVVHFESLAEAFGGFEKDLEHMMSTFVIKGMIASPQPVVDRSELIGKWVMTADETTMLVVSAEGQFTLAEAAGRYRSSEKYFEMLPAGGKAEMFIWSISDGVLSLSGAGLSEPISYRRLENAASVATPKYHPWVGKWKHKTIVLHISPGGSLVLGSSTGRYRAEGGVMKVEMSTGKKHQTFRYRMKGDDLIMEGGRFGKGMRFKRQ